MPFKLIWETRTQAGKRKYSEAWSRGAKAYLRGHHAGHPYFESLKTGNRSVAASNFAKRQAEIVKGSEEQQDQSKVNFAAAVKIYFGSGDPEKIDPTGRVARIFDQIAERMLATFNQTDLDELAKKLCPNAGPKTRNREVYTPFIAVFNAAARSGKVLERRWHRPKGAHDKISVNPPTDRQIARMIKAATNPWGRTEWERARNKAAILTYTLTGDRTGALINVLWSHIDFDAGTIFFRKTKNDEPRTLLMPPLLTKALKDLAQHGSDPKTRVFGWETRFGPARMIAYARKRAGLEHIRPHDIGRHAFGRRGRQQIGFDRAELKQAGNWKSDAAVEVYDHLALDEIKEKLRDVDTSELDGGEG